MESASNRPLSSAKWSRNSQRELPGRANRLRMMERQRQILENKIQRRHQQSAHSGVTQSRPSTSGPIRARTPVSSSSGISTFSGLASSDNRDSQLDDSDSDYLDDYENEEYQVSRSRSKSSIPGTRKQPKQRSISPVHSPSQNSGVLARFEKNIKAVVKKGSPGGSKESSKSLSRSEVNLRSAGLNSPTDSIDSNHENYNYGPRLGAGPQLGTSAIPNPNPLTTILTEEQLRKFVGEPVSPAITMQCLIIRDKKGFDRSFYPTYYMHLQDIVINHQSSSSSPSTQYKANLATQSSAAAAAGGGNHSSAGSPDGRSNTSPLNTNNHNSDSIDSLESIKSDDEPGSIANGSNRRGGPRNGSGPGNGANNNGMGNGNSGMNNSSPTRNYPTAKGAAESSGRKVFMLSGRRRKKSKTYLIGNNAFDISRQHSLAKLKSNVLGTQFTAIRLEPSGGRHEVVSVIYETNVLGFKGPRKMSVIVPKPDEEEYRRNSRAVTMLKNKTPIWNEETQSYVLNFHGRVTQASVKNFQLVPAVATNPQPSSNGRKGEMQRSTSLHQLRHGQNSNGSSSNNNINNGNGSSNKDINSLSKYDDDEESEEENEEESDDDVQYDSDRKSRQEFASTRPMSKSFSKSGFLSSMTDEGQRMGIDSNEHVSLQFGRVSDTHFSCDVSWPLSLIQAFAIALSSFDSKLACE